jgi:hypothetical protein
MNTKRLFLKIALLTILALANEATAQVASAKSDGPSKRAKEWPALELELKGEIGAERRFYVTTDAAPAAFSAGYIEKAKFYAKDLLAIAPDWKENWNYGNAIHNANLVLGRIALRSNDMDEAKGYLLEAGRTPGSPQLNSFGPDMTLAKELLEKGETKTVLEYLDLCGKFWKMHADNLGAWKAQIEKGEVPDFRSNLIYVF